MEMNIYIWMLTLNIEQKTLEEIRLDEYTIEHYFMKIVSSNPE